MLKLCALEWEVSMQFKYRLSKSISAGLGMKVVCCCVFKLVMKCRLLSLPKTVGYTDLKDELETAYETQGGRGGGWGVGRLYAHVSYVQCKQFGFLAGENLLLYFPSFLLRISVDQNGLYKNGKSISSALC